MPDPRKKDKVDIYHYNFLTHKPRYVYTTDKRRLKKHTNHYDKYANDFEFKKSIKAFFAVEEEFPRPDYSRRGPAESWNDVQTINRSYGGKRAFHL